MATGWPGLPRFEHPSVRRCSRHTSGAGVLHPIQRAAQRAISAARYLDDDVFGGGDLKRSHRPIWKNDRMKRKSRLVPTKLAAVSTLAEQARQADPRLRIGAADFES